MGVKNSWSGSEWQLETDIRGKTIYDSAGYPAIVADDNLLPDGYSVTAPVIDTAAAAKSAALAQTIFSKLQIRRAMRALGIESQLDALLASSSEFASDWADAQDINTADALTAQALALASVDINSIKLQIAGLC